MSWLGLRIPSEIFTPCGKKVGNLYDLVRITRFAGMEPGVESFGENREGIRHTSQGQFADRVDLDDSGASLMQPGRARGKSGDESRSVFYGLQYFRRKTVQFCATRRKSEMG